MINTILGLKGKTSQTFIEGFKVAVTKVVVGPCIVTDIKNMERDGYHAVQLGFSSRKAKNTPKPVQGHLKKSQNSDNKTTTFSKFIKEIRFKEATDLKIGDVVNVSDVIKPGDVVTVTGITKGKGFAGVVKKHGFAGGPRTHGQSDRERAPGSVGQTTTPGRVYKGKRMAGRMGSATVSIKNLHVVSVNNETNEVEISGQIPGTVGTLITINKTKSGSLKELEHEVVAQVTEGEEGAAEKKEETK